MKNLNWEIIPATVAEDSNHGRTTWYNGKLVQLDEGTHVTMYFKHTEETDMEGNKSLTAIPVRVKKPLTRGRVIDAAERLRYRLLTVDDVASFNASLARKSRMNPHDAEVVEHDSFITEVKQALTDINM